MNKIKVVWICHFSNQEIRNKLPLTKKNSYTDFSPWIVNLAKAFENNEEVELHIIAPHRGMLNFTYSFNNKGIFYHFFKPDNPIIHKNWPLFFPLHKWTMYYKNKLLVHKIIKKIKPDIVNLHGAENDYYSITVLGIKKIPVFVCIQGIYSNPQRFNNHIKQNKLKIKIERQIHKTCTYFGIFPPFFAELIKKDNKNPIFFIQNYIPNIEPIKLNFVEKKYDFIYWGRVSDVKGINKIIEAVAYINSKGRKVTLNIIGNHENEYLKYLKKLITNLELEKSISFSGHFPSIQEVHQKAIEGKVTVISSKFENLPGTIIESVLLNQPITATAVGGIPFLNKDGETILLSKYGDIEELANNMLKLLDNPEYAKELTTKCKNFIYKEFNDKKIVERYINQYKAIIAHYKNKIPIDTKLLYDEKIFEYKTNIN